MTSYAFFLGLLIAHLAFCGLPTAFAAGGSCLALPVAYGPVCSSDTSIFGSPGHKIRYSISVTGSTLLCCQAYYCKDGSCRLRSVGCGHGNWKTGILPWGNNLATPKMKCRGVPLGSAYTFTH